MLAPDIALMTSLLASSGVIVLLLCLPLFGEGRLGARGLSLVPRSSFW